MDTEAQPKPPAPVIVVKKKKGHGGHHGGAWKVAYADFVTAMMAFFLVMWLVSQSDKVKEGVGGYFRDPAAFGQGEAILTGAGAPLPHPSATAPVDQTRAQALEEAREAAEQEVRRRLEAAGEAIRADLYRSEEFRALRDQVEIEMTDEGLRIQMIEPGKNEAFFHSGSAELNPTTRQVLGVISAELNHLPNHVVIEGHTDSLRFASGSRYTNWELSVDRANSARAAMEEAGLPPGQIREVRGYAANRPRFPDHPEDPRNRRISILVLNDFAESIQRPIELAGQTFVYQEGVGYRQLGAPAEDGSRP
jgi:chemotaxis protein MotB